MKCRRGGARSAPTPGTRVAGKLRQRLPAEAGAAGAEEDDVGGVFGEPAAGVADRRQIVMGFRQPQQRQAAVGMARAQGIERGLGAVERGVERLVGNAVRPDVLFQRAVDGLDEWPWLQDLICLSTSRKRTQRVHSALEVSPFGRPATVTSMPPL